MFEVLGTILLVDRPGPSRDTAARRLRREGYVVIEAGHAHEALDRLGRDPIDLAVIAAALPGHSGFELLGWLRGRFSRGELPVLMRLDEPAAGARALAAGATEVLVGPVDPLELGIRIARRLDDRRRDPLTGLLANRAFRAIAEQALEAARADGRQVGLLAIELGGLRLVNEVAGYAAGDRALCAFARRLARLTEPGALDAGSGATPFASRLGGAIFHLLLPDRPADEDLGATMRGLVRAHLGPFAADEPGFVLTPAAGLAAFPGDVGRAGLFRVADVALQQVLMLGEAGARPRRRTGRLGIATA